MQCDYTMQWQIRLLNELKAGVASGNSKQSHAHAHAHIQSYFI